MLNSRNSQMLIVSLKFNCILLANANIYTKGSSRVGMYRKGLGGMETLDNACMGANIIQTHPFGEITNSDSALGQGALEQTQRIQHTTVAHR